MSGNSFVVVVVYYVTIVAVRQLSEKCWPKVIGCVRLFYYIYKKKIIFDYIPIGH